MSSILSGHSWRGFVRVYMCMHIHIGTHESQGSTLDIFLDHFTLLFNFD